MKVLNQGGSVIVVAVGVPVAPPAFAYALSASGEILKKLNPYLESGKVKAVLDPKGPFPFDNVEAAFAHIETNHATGKVVVYPIP